jgi:hypothetical protein
MRILLVTALFLMTASCEKKEEADKRKRDEAWARTRVMKRLQQVCDEFCGVMENRITAEKDGWVCTCNDGSRKELL